VRGCHHPPRRADSRRTAGSGRVGWDAAVGLLDLTATDRPALARAYGLGRHPVTLYWAGQITLTSHSQLLACFYRNAPVSVRIGLTRFIGRSLQQTDDLDPAVAERLTQLWEARVQAVRDGTDSEELRAFGEWFGAGSWGRMGTFQLLTALSAAGGIESEYVVLPPARALVRLAHQHLPGRLAPVCPDAAELLLSPAGSNHHRHHPRGRPGQRRRSRH
jgi:hypothetical protein